MTPAELSLWDSPRFTHKSAALFLEELDVQTPYVSRSMYIKSMSAIKVAYSTDLGRKTADNKISLGGVLDRAVNWKNIEYYANGARWRILNGIDRCSMANGTVGNEAEHHDMKAWAENVYQQTRERATLVLKAWETSKILSHVSSFHSPSYDKSHGE